MQNLGQAQAQARAQARVPEDAAPGSFCALFLAQFATLQIIARNVGTLIIPGVFYSVERPPGPKCAKELRTGPGAAPGTCRGAVVCG